MLISEPVVLRRTGQWWFLVVCWALFPLIGLAGLVAGADIGERVFAATILVLTGVLWIRLLRAAVYVSDDGVRIRGLFRTHEVPWDQVERAEVVSANSLGIVCALVVRRRERRPIKVDAVGNFRFRKPLDGLPVSQMARLINERLGALVSA